MSDGSKSESVIFELAAAPDVEQIAHMSRTLIESGLQWRWTPLRIVKQLRCPDTLVLVARDGPKLIGFAIMHFAWEDAHLLLFAVDRHYQRRGVGQGLLAWLEKSAQVAGIARIHLEVRADNKSGREFYRVSGFNETQFMPRYYDGRVAAIRMLKKLRVSA